MPGRNLPRAGLEGESPIAIAMLRHRDGTKDALQVRSWLRRHGEAVLLRPLSKHHCFLCLTSSSCDVYLHPPTIPSSIQLQTLVRKSFSASLQICIYKPLRLRQTAQPPRPRKGAYKGSTLLDITIFHPPQSVRCRIRNSQENSHGLKSCHTTVLRLFQRVSMLSISLKYYAITHSFERSHTPFRAFN